MRVFHELSWVEDMGSGTRNILRYAPLYYPDYKVEIVNDILRYAPLYYPDYKVEIVNGSQFIFSITYMEMSVKTEENVSQNLEMSVKNEDQFETEELALSIDDTPRGKKNLQKKQKRHQGIISLIRHNPQITAEEMAEKLDVKVRTIYRDLEELKHLIKYVGPSKGGYWKLLK